MLRFLVGSGRASDRKLRLFSVACLRQIWPLLWDKRSRRAVEAGEQYADGLVTQRAMLAARKAAEAVPRGGYHEEDWARLAAYEPTNTDDPQGGAVFAALRAAH